MIFRWHSPLHKGQPNNSGLQVTPVLKKLFIYKSMLNYLITVLYVISGLIFEPKLCADRLTTEFRSKLTSYSAVARNCSQIAVRAEFTSLKAPFFVFLNLFALTCLVLAKTTVRVSIHITVLYSRRYVTRIKRYDYPKCRWKEMKISGKMLYLTYSFKGYRMERLTRRGESVFASFKGKVKYWEKCSVILKAEVFSTTILLSLLHSSSRQRRTCNSRVLAM